MARQARVNSIDTQQRKRVLSLSLIFEIPYRIIIVIKIAQRKLNNFMCGTAFICIFTYTLTLSQLLPYFETQRRLSPLLQTHIFSFMRCLKIIEN